MPRPTDSVSMLTVLGPDKKPVPLVSVEFRGDAIPMAEKVERGTFSRKGPYGMFFQTDSQWLARRRPSQEAESV